MKLDLLQDIEVLDKDGVIIPKGRKTVVNPSFIKFNDPVFMCSQALKSLIAIERTKKEVDDIVSIASLTLVYFFWGTKFACIDITAKDVVEIPTVVDGLLNV